MKLGSLGRSFDVIAATGVLHHLADPFAGWRVLLSLLRPGGVMHIGLYSELARRDIVAARKLFAQRGFGGETQEIWRARQELIDAAGNTPLHNVTQMSDFFSLSECRDLLFHVQEHRLTLPAIRQFLAETGLDLIGFALPARVLRGYRARFPDDEAMTDLDHWHGFETENPDTFINMYDFWVQKPPETAGAA
jgi:SAM-dependent methyltransferase